MLQRQSEKAGGCLPPASQGQLSVRHYLQACGTGLGCGFTSALLILCKCYDSKRAPWKRAHGCQLHRVLDYCELYIIHGKGWGFGEREAFTTKYVNVSHRILFLVIFVCGYVQLPVEAGEGSWVPWARVTCLLEAAHCGGWDPVFIRVATALMKYHN